MVARAELDRGLTAIELESVGTLGHGKVLYDG